jgi:hypothetical protein
MTHEPESQSRFHDHEKRELPSHDHEMQLTFSLTGLMLIVTMSAIVVAAITRLPEWIGAPILALVAITATAVVVTAAAHSGGCRRTFYLGAAVPLIVLMIPTAEVSIALAKGIAEQQGTSKININSIGIWDPNYATDEARRNAYRWLAACALAAAPLVGFVCVAFRRIGESRGAHADTAQAAAGRRRAMLLITLLFALLTGFLLAIEAWRRVAGWGDPWDQHDGSAVTATGTPVSPTAELANGDKVFVEQSGAWWRGRVLSVNVDGSVKIHYVGWPSSSDETVSPSRLQVP